MRPWPAALLVGCALVVAGCSGDDDAGEAPPPVGSAKQRAAAQRVVDRVWRAVIARDSALPLFYDDRVVRSIDARELRAVVYVPSVQFAVRPRVISVDRTPLGLSVITESRPDDGPPLHASYLFRKVGAEWRILYDSNLARNLDRLTGSASLLRRRPLNPAGEPRVLAETDLRLRRLAARSVGERARALGPLLTRNYLRDRPSGRPPPGSG